MNDRLLRTQLCERLGIEHPICLAGMHGVSTAPVVSAVSAAGGLGVLGADGWSPTRVTDECARVRATTDRPFGVDFLLAFDPNPMDAVRAAIDGGATVLVAGLGVPEKIVQSCHDNGVFVMSMVGKPEHARRAEAAGCDAVVAQGAEAGGHTGAIGSIVLWPQIVDAVSIPVLAAGGIVDGRGLAAALVMGCQGVWVGTRFVASSEANAHARYKDKLVAAASADTAVSRCWTGKPLRALRNATTDFFDANPDAIIPFPGQFVKMTQDRMLGFSVGPSLDDALVDAACWPAGQGTGGIHDVKSCRDIIDEMVREARFRLHG